MPEARTTGERASFYPQDTPRNYSTAMEKRLAARIGGKPSKTAGFRLEADLHSELHFSRIQSASRLTKAWVCVLVVGSSACGCKEEVRTVEHVEGIRIELQVHPLGDFEVLGHSHVREPVTRADERVATKVAVATQARRGECDVGRRSSVRRSIRLDSAAPAICPIRVGNPAHSGDTGIGAAVSAMAQIEVATHIYAGAVVNISHATAAVGVRTGQGRWARSERLPVRTSLEL